MVRVVVGLMGSSVQAGSTQLSTPEGLRSLLSLLHKHKISELDTARVYNSGKSEELLGQVQDELEAGKFTIHTKAPAFSSGSLTYDNIVRHCNASLAALGKSSVDLYYLHGPDRQTPLEQSCKAIQTLYEEGKFSQWGVSNLHVDEGGYNPLLRAMEPDLLPTLRRHGMAFYAYSPLGGGYFSKPISALKSPPSGGRMEQMKVFQQIYVNDTSIKLRQDLDEACEKHGVPNVREATLRWLMHHSPLGSQDAVILGGASVEQMEANVLACEQGPLPEAVVEAFERMWSRYRDSGLAGTYCIPK